MPDIGNEVLVNAQGGFFLDKADVVVDTANLTEEQWHYYRTLGIGGSDVGAIFGISPWTTAREVYLRKTGASINEQKIDAGQSFIFMYGHAMEPIVANTFQEITGLEVQIDTYMYRHKEYPFMQANIDRFVIMPDGKKALLECKTTTFFNKSHWENNQVPMYYKLQCQHYMAILDVDVCYIACIYGNTINDFVCRRIDRDLDEEKKLIEIEKEFWENNVLLQSPPMSRDGKLETVTSLKTLSPVSAQKEPLKIEMLFDQNMKNYLELEAEKKRIQKQLDDIESRMLLEVLPLKEYMNDRQKAEYQSEDGKKFRIDFSQRNRVAVNAKKLELLYPEIYSEVRTESQYRVFSIKTQ